MNKTTHVIKTYDEDMKGAIAHQHNKALQSAERAHVCIVEAVDDRRSCGALIDKFKQSHPQDIRKQLADTMSPREINRSLSSFKTVMIWPDELDTAQLVFAGILKQQAIEYSKESIKKTKPTMFRSITKAINQINTAAKDNDFSRWSEDEREVTRRALKSLNKSCEGLDL